MRRRTVLTSVGTGLGVAGYVGAASAQDPALFEVSNVWTNSPVGPGEILEVDATIENVGDETGTTDVELVVGYDPQIEDSVLLTLGPGDRETITLEFRAGDPADGYEEFPVRVDTGAHTVTEMVAVID
ncbi:hypothetical protein RBH26_01825 [Natronolimnohabitans sp. A-GB9]|uniref:hypothetical protein n=1 Tax=Natronolimnohabitans sp. A-GB9 TaxID=3069757 RepID=UPI0027AFE763|nr:hypothetical protein [Natronolimnohabitans sp. A-GB9]MDQ2049213.1 hypothetical protein [Natronolimnohabitans sp. A-GB9]